MNNSHYNLLVLLGLLVSLTTLANDRSATIALSPDGNTLAVVNNDSRSVSLVDPADGAVIAEILVGKDPQAVSFDGSGQWAYVANRFDDTVSVVT